MKILAIDPGPVISAYVIWDGQHVEQHGIVPNRELFPSLGVARRFDACAIEMIASYGMAVGAEVFETCVFIGRFVELWRAYAGMGEPLRIPRLDVKVHLCKTAKAKDANVRQALIDRFGSPGTKREPGRLYGITSHCWAALAVAVCAHDRMACGMEKTA